MIRRQETHRISITTALCKIIFNASYGLNISATDYVQCIVLCKQLRPWRKSFLFVLCDVGWTGFHCSLKIIATIPSRHRRFLKDLPFELAASSDLFAFRQIYKYLPVWQPLFQTILWESSRHTWYDWQRWKVKYRVTQLRWRFVRISRI